MNSSDSTTYLVYKTVPLSSLEISEYNSRTQKEQEDNDEFIELVQSIRQNGLLEPLVVRPLGKERFEIVAGSRRYHALSTLGESHTSVIIRKDLNDIDARVFSIIENIHRKKLDPDELEGALKAYYHSTVDLWKPDPATDTELAIMKDIGGMLELAKLYMSRLHNEQATPKDYPKEDNRLSYYQKVYKQPELRLGKRGRKLRFYPTDQFRELAIRIGYAFSTQYNILRGYGAFREGKNYLAELSDEMIQLIDEKYQEAAQIDPELKKKEKNLKQKMAHSVIVREGKGKAKQNYDARARATNTLLKRSKSAKLKRSSGILAKVIEEEKQAKKAEKEYNKKLEQEKTDKDFKWEVSKSTKSQKPEIEINPSLAREQIMNLCPKLFKFLTGMELDVFDLERSEIQAKSRQAKDNMIEIATHYADTQEIAGLQHIIIPTNQALTIFRDLVYESVESKNKQDEIFKE